MELKESTALKLISEMKKPGRECLYGLSSKGYRNNHLKQGLWLTIATSIGIERSECQALWKSLRRRYKTAKTKNTGRSGSERVELKGFLKILVSEMEYFQNFWEDDDPSVTNYVDGNTNKFRELFDEMAQNLEYTESPTDTSQSNPAISSPPSTSNESQKRKRLRLADAEVELDKSLKTLNSLASSIIKAEGDKIDPYFLALQEEFSKVAEDKKSALKLKLMSMVIEHQS